jgi:hypothetical protein
MTKDIADIKMAMVAIISSVISYYFGASKKDKSEQNVQSVDTNSTTK